MYHKNNDNIIYIQKYDIHVFAMILNVFFIKLLHMTVISTHFDLFVFIFHLLQQLRVGLVTLKITADVIYTEGSFRKLIENNNI